MNKIILLCLILALLIALPLHSQQESSSISGTVGESVSGEAVIGANVILYADTSQLAKPISGAVTNKFGFYSFPKVNAGRYYLRVRGLGYKQYVTEIAVSEAENIRLNILIDKADIMMKEITVEAEREAPQSKTISTITVSPEFISRMPSLGGEVDLFRTLQLLPGVSQSSELMSGLYIRGSSPDQNLVLLDGVIVYNPSHLFGFLSTFNNDAIKDIKLIKGGFPAEYGGRMSSVLDLAMKEGTKEKISGSGGISLISSRLTLEGPISENSTFMISGRRMYLDVLTWLMYPNEDMPSYYFYDLNAKLNYKLGESDHLFLSGFFCRDVFSTPETRNDDRFEIKWGNATGNLRWMHIVSPSLFTNFSMIYTHYKFSSDFYSNDSTRRDFSTLSGIEDFTLRAQAEYFPSSEHTVKAGLELTNHNFEARANEWLINEINSEFDLNFKSANIINAMDAAIYIQDEWKISPLFETNIGGRAYYFQEGNYWGFEPRLLLSYALKYNTFIKGSVSLAHQFLHLITRNDVTLPTDLWFPSTKTIKPGRTWQGVLGFETTFLDGEYLFSAEAYYKDMQNLYEYKDNAEFSFGIPLETQFTRGKGEAYGFELFLNKRMGPITGWIGYTLAWTRRQFDELNDGKPFYPRYDRRHDVSLTLMMEIGESWELGMAWVYGTGQAFTMPTGVYGFSEVGSGWSSPEWDYYNAKYDFSERNGYRMPAYHRLDLNFMHKFEWFGVPFRLSLNIYNTYNRRNTFSMYLDYDFDGQGNYKWVLKKITLFPIIPTLGLSFNF